MKAKVLAIMPPHSFDKKAFSTIHIELEDRLEKKKKLAVRAFEPFERLKALVGENIKIDLVGHRNKMGETHHYTFNSIQLAH